MINECNDIHSIPLFNKISWLNSSLMAALYSQRSNYIVKKASKKWDKNNSLLMYFKNIIFKIKKHPDIIKK